MSGEDRWASSPNGIEVSLKQIHTHYVMISQNGTIPYLVDVEDEIRVILSRLVFSSYARGYEQGYHNGRNETEGLNFHE